LSELIVTTVRWVVALSVVWTTVSYGDELCSDWKDQRQPELAIPESEFTQEAMTDALDRLAELAATPSTQNSYYAEQQLLVFVEGWLLKKAAIAATHGQEAAEDTPALERYCEFLVEKGYYYD